MSITLIKIKFAVMIINYNDFNLNIKLNNSETSKAIQKLNDFKAKINT